jgi:acyl-homoserine lactone acylase PvdQ
MILLLAQPDSKWWDNAATSDRVETRDDILQQSLADAARDLVAQYGADPNGWQWGKLHTITFVHRALGTQPVAFIYNRGPFPVSGYTSLVNATNGNFALPINRAIQVNRHYEGDIWTFAAADRRFKRSQCFAFHSHDRRKRLA